MFKACGYREQELRESRRKWAIKAKRRGIVKLVIRGGSIAAGYGVDKSYVDILTEALLPKGIEVINRSKYRETSFDGIELFDKEIARYEPDVLLIHFGVDDAFQCVYRSEFQENLVQMIRLARRLLNPVIFLATSHTFDNPNDMSAVDIFYRSIGIVASDLKCELIPVHHYWNVYLEKNDLSSRDLTQKDSRYPNERGHEVIAGILLKSFSRILNGLDTIP